MTSVCNDAENNVVRRKTRSARANYLACQQPLYGPKKRQGLWWGCGELRTYRVSWMGCWGTRQSLKKLPLPSQTMGTIEHGSSAKRRLKTWQARYTNNYFIRKRLPCAAWTRDLHLAFNKWGQDRIQIESSSR